MRLFVFGTLIDPKVQIKIFGRTIALSDTVWLSGFRVGRKYADDGFYPALITKDGGTVAGKILELTESDLLLADEYEGTAYRRIFDPRLNAFYYL